MKKSEFVCDGTVIHEDVVSHVKENMLTGGEFELITNFFKTIGDSTRIKIMWALYIHEMCVCDLASLLQMTKSAISHQLSKLRESKLVSCKKSGKAVYYSLADDHVTSSIKNALEHVKE